MSKDRHHRLHELFTAAVDLPADQRNDWLQEECDGDYALLTEVRALLAEDQRSQDPLEAGVRQVLRQRGNGPAGDETLSRNSLLDDFELAKRRGELPDSDLSSDEFCDQLSEIEILSGDELVKWLESVQPPETREDPQALARQLVAEGKLTEFQASVLLGGKSKKLLIDKYLILDLLDSGGMGMVFKAVHRTMKRVVALKMLPPGRFSSPAAVQRFRREVQVAATLEHPNVVTAHDADESKGVHFLVMEYVRGRDLYKKVTADGPLSVAQAVQCVLQAAAGLQHAHEKGIIHRDIKPGNLILADTKTIKILGLGLASIGDRTEPEASAESERRGEQLTRSGALLGTIAYMAPEQAVDSAAVDARCDIYSLGCTFYFLLTGETLYGSDPVKSIDRHQNAKIPSLRDKRPDVADAIDAIYQKMLAKDPDERQQSMAEVISAIKACELPRSNRDDVADVGTHHSAQRKRSHERAQKNRVRLTTWGTKQTVCGLISVTVLGLLFLIGVKNWMSALTPPAPTRQPTATPAAPGDPPPLAIAPFDAEQARQHQEAWARYLGVPVEYTDSLGIKFSLIPPGRFGMGCKQSESEMQALFEEKLWVFHREQPWHQVEISRPFYLATFEITQLQWATVMEHWPEAADEREATHDGRPMAYVSWVDSEDFCEQLTLAAEGTYRLPTEAEWEYACRAGTESPFYFGEDAAPGRAHAWYGENSIDVGTDGTSDVGGKTPNAFGLYDMIGNVWEWCDDWMDDAYYEHSPPKDPTGPVSGDEKVLRGGSWRDGPQCLRTTARLQSQLGHRADNRGLRVVLSVASVQALATMRVDETSRGRSTGSATQTVFDDPPSSTKLTSFRVSVNGLAGRDSIEPEAVDADWISETAWAGISRTSGSMRFPSLPVGWDATG